MQKSGSRSLKRPSIVVSPERCVISCIRAIRYRYVHNGRQRYICERCAVGITTDIEAAHGFMDLVWEPAPCKRCNALMITVRPMESCQLCLLSYQYLMSTLGFHGITTERISRISYDVNHRKLLELNLQSNSV